MIFNALVFLIIERFHIAGKLFLMVMLAIMGCQSQPEADYLMDDHGAIIRMDTTEKVIYPVFTGHEYFEGFPVIKEVLDNYDIRASFFFTGDFYRNPQYRPIIESLKREGHYLGAHSDKHLLYCAWENRDSLLIDKEIFMTDIKANYREMKKFGIKKEDALYFMPPYEWYNTKISEWTNEYGLLLINFTPGTRSNADYTWPEMGGRYVDSETIFRSILEYEEKRGMNGFILLIHPGTDPRRKDKFYNRLDELIKILIDRGYSFSRLDF